MTLAGVETLVTRAFALISPGDAMDSSKLVAMITRAAVCADCITTKFGASHGQANATLARLATGLKITTRVARCGTCLKQTVVYWSAPLK